MSDGDEKRGTLLQNVAIVTGVIYIGFSVWRLSTLETYQDSIVQSDGNQNALSELYVTSSGLIYGNYILLLVFSLAVLYCGYKAVSKRDTTLLGWHICADLGCVTVLVFSFANLIITGDLISDTTDEASVPGLRATFVLSLMITSVLCLLYIVSFVLAISLYRSKSFRMEVTSLTTAPAPSTRSKTVTQREVEADSDIPYATPV